MIPSARIRRGRLLLLFSVAILGSCDSEAVFSPVRQLGDFELTHRNGGSLPQAVDIPWPRSTGFVSIQSIDGGSLALGSLHDYRLILRVKIQGVSEVIVLGEGQATFTAHTVVIPLPDGRLVTGNYGPPEGRQTITLFMGEPWGTLLFRRPNSLAR